MEEIFFGDGVEGWPNVVHGGALTTIVKDAMEKLASKVYPPGTGEVKRLRVDFYKKVTPGDSYYLIAHALPKGQEWLDKEGKDMKLKSENSILVFLKKGDEPDHLEPGAEFLLAMGHFDVPGGPEPPPPLQMDEHGNFT